MIEGIKVIGLCGRSGSGKGYVCEAFWDFGVPSVDTDRVYRSLVSAGENGMSSCLVELVEEFGEGVLDKSASLDRKALAAIVFEKGNSLKLERLNEITHKYILEETLAIIKELANKGYKAVIVDAPVLFESGFDKICDHIFCVTAPDSVLVWRICKRDGIDCDAAAKRLRNQKTAKELRALCDGEIVNDGFADVYSQVGRIVEDLRKE